VLCQMTGEFAFKFIHFVSVVLIVSAEGNYYTDIDYLQD
jgi:hypothetical protein